MSTSRQIKAFFSKPVIPVLWDVGKNQRLISHASSVILQGGSISSLAGTIGQFQSPALDHLRLLVHIDLVAGLEKNEAGLELLAQIPGIHGVVTVHHHLAKPAKGLGFLSIVRMFLSDSRALERAIQIAEKARPDLIELLPASAAGKVADDFRNCPIPRIAGGLCRTPLDVKETIDSGCIAVTSTRPGLWELNQRG